MPKKTEARSLLMANLGVSHASLLLLAHYTQSLVVLCDPEGDLIYLNPAGRELIGVAKADIFPQRVIDYIVPAQRDTICAEIAAIVSDTGSWQGPMQLVNAGTGAIIDVQRSTFCMRDEAGTVTGYVSVMDLLDDAETDADHELLAALVAGGAHDTVEHSDIITRSALAEQLVHDINNMVAAVMSGFSTIERRAHEPAIQAIAVAGKKAAEEGLLLARRLKELCS